MTDVDAFVAFLLKRCYYVPEVLPSVARYPIARAKLQTIEDICKFFGENLRKSYVKRKRLPLEPYKTKNNLLTISVSRRTHRLRGKLKNYYYTMKNTE